MVDPGVSLGAVSLGLGEVCVGLGVGLGTDPVGAMNPSTGSAASAAFMNAVNIATG